MKANGVAKLQLHICLIFMTEGGKGNSPHPYYKHEAGGTRTGLDTGEGRNFFFLPETEPFILDQPAHSPWSLYQLRYPDSFTVHAVIKETVLKSQFTVTQFFCNQFNDTKTPE
jgi:hypothetical protein